MLRPIRCSLICLLFAFLVLPQSVRAMEDELPPPDVVIVVTGERTPVPVSESIASTTVITAQAIREQGAQTVADVLRLVPGLTLRQSGQLGALATTSIRGSNSNQLLVLVDGRRISSPAFYVGADTAKFPVSDIARVEVIRGPASSLYGSEAIGGVINIITKRPSRDGGEATLGFGRHGRSERALALHGVAEAFDWQLNTSFPAYDGFRPNSDFSATNLSGRVTLPALAGWEVSLHGEDYHDRLGLPGADPYGVGLADPDDRMWWKRQVADFAATRPLGMGDVEVRTYRNRQQLRNLAPGPWGTFDSLITGVTAGAEVVYRLDAGMHRWVIGAEYRDDKYENVESGFDTSVQREGITNRALFIQDRLAFEGIADVVLGARLDDHATAGSKVTPRAGISRELMPGTRLRASYAEGFRAPNFVELYYPEGPWGPGYAGNPDLQPELSQQYEVGMNLLNGRLDVAAFTANVRDLIVATSATPHENVGRARRRGVEVTWGNRLANGVALDMTYTYLDAVNRATGARMLGQPRHKVTASAARRMLGWDVALIGRWNDERPDVIFDPDTWASETVMVPSFTVFDLSLNRRGQGFAQPYAVVRNLLNASWAEVAGFRGEGRSLEAGMRAMW